MHWVAERLWLAGLLRKEERSVLLFFSRVVYPAQDPRTKIRLQQKLRSALLGDDRLDEQTHLGLAVIRHTLLSRLLDRSEQKAAAVASTSSRATIPSRRPCAKRSRRGAPTDGQRWRWPPPTADR